MGLLGFSAHIDLRVTRRGSPTSRRTRAEIHGDPRFRVGLLNGVNRKWHPNGQLALETESDDQGRELYRREWDDKGALTYEDV